MQRREARRTQMFLWLLCGVQGRKRASDVRMLAVHQQSLVYLPDQSAVSRGDFQSKSQTFDQNETNQLLQIVP